MKDLQNLVSPWYATSWKHIGTSLGIHSGLLNIIEHDNHHKAEDCCNAVLEQWLELDSTATWEKVTQAIDTSAVASPVVTNKPIDPVVYPGMDPVTHGVIIQVSNQMQQYYIKERYKISGDDWPPFQPEHFTSVALIHHKEKHVTVREVIAVSSLTRAGNVRVDDSSFRWSQNSEQFVGMTTKDIKEIFTPLQKSDTTPNVILIEGAPGIGKTILSKEIAFQWANKNLLTEKFLLFLIFLRDPYIKHIKSLKEFVSYAICSSLQNKDVDLIVQYLESRSGINLTIVLDGYDEVSSEIRENSFVAKIINRKILKHCGLVITSRHTASAILHGKVDRRVEILGFTKEDRIKYVSQSLKGNSIEIKQLESYLEKNPFINSLCYIPLNMTILMCIFKEILENGNFMLPKNQTEINDQFICISISRFLRRKKIPMTIRSLDELPAQYKQQFKNLSKLAFELLGRDQVVFNDNDMKAYPNLDDLGLLKVVKYSNFLRNAPVISYNFLHFTMQEFLAAHYVTTLFTWKQINLLREHFWNSRYLNSWVMYVGVTKGDSFALKHFLTGRRYIFQSLLVKANSIASETIVHRVKCLYLFQCFLEAGNNTMCYQLGNYLVDKIIDLSNTTLLPKDMHTLCFFLLRSTTKQWELLDLSNCYIGDNGCNILANLLLGDHTLFINKMNFSHNQLTARSIGTILKLAQSFKVEELIVAGNYFDSKMFVDTFFVDVIQQKLLQEIILSVKTNNKLSIYAINCNNLLSSQAHNYIHSRIYGFYLWNTKFKADDLLKLLSKVNLNTHPGIEFNVYKEVLDNEISTSQSELQKAMNRITENNTTINIPLHLIKFSYILVSQTQVLAYNVNHHQITQVIKHNCKNSISVLNFTSCELSNESLSTIGNVLSIDFTEVQCINFSGCNITDADCKHLCKAIFSRNSAVKHLEEFNLSCNELTGNCINPIVESFKHCVLKTLVISSNAVQQNAFKIALTNLYTQHGLLLNSSFEIPLVVINDMINLQNKLVDNSMHFSCFADVYLIGCKNLDACSLVEWLPSSDHSVLLHSVVFLQCTSMLIDNYVNVTSLLDKNIFLQIEVYETNITGKEVVECAAKLDEICECYANLNVKYILTSDTKLLIKNCNFKELKELSPNFYSVTTLQLTGCEITIETITEVLTNINIFIGLHLIDLSRCNIADEGCNTLCKFFENNRLRNCIVCIKVLNLSHNSLTSVSIIYIVNLLQCCAIEKLILSDNYISNDNFNEVYFKNRHETYVNSISNKPLILINPENTDSKLNFTIYFVNLGINNSLINILNSLMINKELAGSLFLVNTSLQIEYFNKVMSLLQIHRLLTVTIIEGNLKSDVAAFAVEKLKILLHERESSGYRNVQYFLLSKNSLWTNSINKSIVTKILSLNNQTIPNDQSLIEIFLTFKYKQLEMIDLSNCNSGDDGCARLFSGFESYKCGSSINMINISYNNLSLSSAENIAKLIICLKLKTLVISNNELKENHIADALIKLCTETSANTMYSSTIQILNNNCAAIVTCNSTHILIDEMLNCPYNVTYFAMTNCCLYDSDEDEVNDDNHHQLLQYNSLVHFVLLKCKIQEKKLFKIFNALKMTSTLQSLILNSIKITNIVASQIIEVIDKNIYLEKLDLSDCYMLEDGLRSILTAMKKLTFLRYINFHKPTYKQSVHTNNDYFYSPTTSFSLLPSIIGNNKLLEYLNVSNCKIRESDLIGITETISSFKSLKYLDISDNSITDSVATHVALAIRSNRNLEYMNVSNCCMSEHALFIIFNALTALNNLVHIDVSLNIICGTATEEIIKVFSTNMFLTHLSLCQCDLGVEYFVTIMLSPKIHNFLTHLDFSYNEMNDEVVSILSSIILNNVELKYLDISNCSITENGIRIIAEMLRSLSNLRYLNISHNYMSYSSAKYITSAISCNRSIEHLDISYCGFMDTNIVDLWMCQNSALKKLNLRCNTPFQTYRINADIVDELHIEYLDISYCTLSGLQLIKIAKYLQTTSTLKYLDISYNKIPDRAATEIASVILCNPFLETLILSSCDLSRSQVLSITKALQSISKLKHLDISNNTLTFIEESEIGCIIICNSFLEHLNLSNCKLSEVQITSVAKSLSKISQLMYLDISHNEINHNASFGIASIIVNSKCLQTLNLNNCNLKETAFKIISDSLGTITSLASIDMSNNCITFKTAQSIAVAFSKNVDIEQFNLCACLMNNAALTIFSAINQHCAITHLCLRSNPITDEMAKLVGSVLSVNANIKHLDLGHCNLKEFGFIEILDGLTNTTTLHYINVESNVISEELVARIASLIHRNTSLQTLNLSNCNLPKSGTQTLFFAINQIVSLEHLNVNSNVITNCVGADLKDVISKSNKMEHLDLSGCKLDDMELYNMLTSLTASKHLRFLNLRSSHISNESASGLLPAVITNNVSLSYLDFTDCKLQEMGLIIVAKTLQTTSRLKHLSLNCNAIKNAAAYEIALAISKNYLLQHLSLSDCELKQEGLMAIAEALCIILSLKHLDLSHNVITDAAAATVAMGVTNNTTMQCLDMRFCKWQNSGITAISKVLNHIPTINLMLDNYEFLD